MPLMDSAKDNATPTLEDPTHLDLTTPSQVPDRGVEPGGPKRKRRWRILRWFILLIVVAVALAGAAGYVAGKQEQQAKESQEIQQIIQEQYALGLVDLEQERFDVAVQRFEYVIRLDPTFPGTTERLAEALLGLNEPPPTPTAPVLTPTPNLAPVEEIFVQAEEAYLGGDYTSAIEQLLALRSKDPDYRAVEVDGLFYAALRARGIARISNEQRLEEGIYDLSLAESFAPLDGDATDWRSWAELYLTANSYFGLNWEQATLYFDLVYLVAPGIKNDVFWKYVFSIAKFGEVLFERGEFCESAEQYQKAQELQYSEEVQPRLERAIERCEESQRSSEPPPPDPTETPSGDETPTETLEPTPTEDPGGGGNGGD
jgi:tetratricopeptide (TPR) repeat protein